MLTSIYARLMPPVPTGKMRRCSSRYSRSSVDVSHTKPASSQSVAPQISALSGCPAGSYGVMEYGSFPLCRIAEPPWVLHLTSANRHQFPGDSAEEPERHDDHGRDRDAGRDQAPRQARLELSERRVEERPGDQFAGGPPCSPRARPRPPPPRALRRRRRRSTSSRPRARRGPSPVAYHATQGEGLVRAECGTNRGDERSGSRLQAPAQGAVGRCRRRRDRRPMRRPKSAGWWRRCAGCTGA